jgi:hypothetical protein
MIKRGGGRVRIADGTTSVPAATSSNKSNWGGRGGCLGFLVYLFAGLSSSLNSAGT